MEKNYFLKNSSIVQDIKTYQNFNCCNSCLVRDTKQHQYITATASIMSFMMHVSIMSTLFTRLKYTDGPPVSMLLSHAKCVSAKKHSMDKD